MVTPSSHPAGPKTHQFGAPTSALWQALADRAVAQRRIVVGEALIARQAVGDVEPGDAPDLHLTIRRFGVTDTL